jgi:hypothetical protein
MSVLNEYTDANYFIPPAYGKQGLKKRAIADAADISANMVRAYPNPADYMVTLQLLQQLPTTEVCTLIIADIMGREVHNQQVNPAQIQFVINTKTWAVGLYTYKILVPNSLIELNGKIDVVH